MPNGLPPGLMPPPVPPGAGGPPGADAGGPPVGAMPPMPPMPPPPPERKRAKHKGGKKSFEKHGGGRGMVGAGRQPKPRGGGFY